MLALHTSAHTTHSLFCGPVVLNSNGRSTVCVHEFTHLLYQHIPTPSHLISHNEHTHTQSCSELTIYCHFLSTDTYKYTQRNNLERRSIHCVPTFRLAKILSNACVADMELDNLLLTKPCFL